MDNQASSSRGDILQKALTEIRSLKARLKEAEEGEKGAIAIVGAGCRFPGGVDSPEAYWDFLKEGRLGTSTVPADRFDIERYYDAEPKKPGRIACRDGAFLDAIDRFDAAHFNISPKEAAAMDPQQRLLLEVAYEALEDAGIVIDRANGLLGGVFLGISGIDYALKLLSPGNEGRIDPYFGAGTVFSAAAGRLSYVFGLTGPCFAADTACSSSLLAVHLASQSLRRGECRFALACGVNLIMGAALSVNFSQSGLLSPDGKTRAFDAEARGYTRGEGCGVVVLKRLSDALADGDRIWAVVRGSATNQDGHSGGLTVPSGRAQERVILDALNDAGLSPDDIDCLEAHGTGTPLGDPIELNALGRVFGERKSIPKLRVGSVKTNLGHLEAAAGMASLFKVIQSIRHGIIPPHLHWTRPNPEVEWDRMGMRIPTAREEWPDRGRPRRAGVSAFSFSGSNAHLILEQAPKQQAIPAAETKALPIVVSARTETALNVRLSQIAETIESMNGAAGFQDTAWTLDCARMIHPFRAAAIASDAAAAAETLRALANGKREKNGVRGKGIKTGARRRIAFLFTGQGAQYIGMGAGLFKEEPVFRRVMEQCDEICRPLIGRSLLELIYPDGVETKAASGTLIHPAMFGRAKAAGGGLDDTRYAQPATFAVETALARLWESWGVRPDFVIGHSLGEYAAAHVAGVFGLEDGLRLVCERGRLAFEQCEPGAMATVFASEERILEILKGAESSASIAAVNGPEALVIAGSAVAMKKALGRLEEERVRFAPLPMGNAFHSSLIEPMSASFRNVLEGVKFSEPSIGYVSNATGGLIQSEAARADYWIEHLRSPVRFADGLEAIRKAGGRALLEIGPDPVLLGLAQSMDLGDEADAPPWLPSLQKGQPDRERMLKSLCGLFVNGFDVSWQRHFSEARRLNVRLPGYPFERKRYWIESLSSETPGDLRHDETQAASTRMDCLYSVEWEQLPAIQSDSQTVATSGAWLLLIEGDSFGRALRQSIEKTGAKAVVLDRDDVVHFEAGSASIRMNAIDDAVGRCLAEEGWEGIVDAWTVNSPDLSSLDRRRLSEDVIGHGAVMSRLLGQALNSNQRPKLRRITRGAAAVSERESLIRPSSASGDALLSCFLAEHPDADVKCVDLPEGAMEGESEQLIKELLAGDREERVALRVDGRHGARLRKAELELPEAAELNTDGYYLITGGLGELGLLAAGMLLERGAGCVALASRSAISAKASERVEAWRALGRKVEVVSLDVSDLNRLRTAFPGGLFQGMPLRGVIHAAGAAVAGKADALTPSDWERSCEGKAIGAWALHELTRDLELDFFVAFSSSASVWGGAGLGAYAAANGCVDALMASRRAAGLPGLAIQWTGWNAGGMHTKASLEALRRSGIEPASPRLGLEILRRALAWQGREFLAGELNGEVFIRGFEGGRKRSLLNALRPVWGGDSVNGDEGSDWKDRLTRADQAERTALMRGYLKEEFAQSLGASERDVRPESELLDLGVTSLMVMEVFNHLRSDLSLMLYPREFYERPRIDELADYVLSQLKLDVETVEKDMPPDSTSNPEASESKKIRREASLPAIQSSPSIRRLPSAVFVLSAPRSGSTLLRAMLAGHGQLFAPPELYLLPYETLDARAEELGASSLGQGLERCFMELMGLDADKAAALVRGFAAGGMRREQAYSLIQSLIQGRTLVDKSPGYASNLETLRTAEALFENAKYVHLTRHPAAVVDSVVRMRMHALISKNGGSAMDVAESNWIASHRNVLEFFKSLPPHRRTTLAYEDLVRDPRAALARLCEFLEIPFQESLLNPYEGNRMTDGTRANSIPAGDPNFLQRSSIDPSLADAWRNVKLDRPLSAKTWSLARELGYEIPAGLDLPLKERETSSLLPPLKRSVEEKGKANPLSFAQQRLWFLDQLEGAHAVYNATRVLRLRGELNLEALRRSLNAVAERHEILRTAIQEEQGRPRQIVGDCIEAPFEVRDLSNAPADTLWREAAREIEAEALRPFDLAKGPLWRALVLASGRHCFRPREGAVEFWEDAHISNSESDSEFLLVLTFHHSAYDGYSLELLYREIEFYYRRDCGENASGAAFPALDAQYGDFARWQREWQASGGLDSQLDYWTRRLSGLSGKLELPGDFARPAVQRYLGGSVYFDWDGALLKRLNDSCRLNRTTPFTVAMTAFQILLSKYSGQTDIAVGTLINNRRLREFDRLLGMFVNTLAIRGNWEGDPSFNEGLERMNSLLQEAYANQDAPFELLVERLQPERTLSYQPLFQVMFAMHNARVALPKLSGATVSAIEPERTRSKFDLNFILTPGSDGMAGVVEYNAELFKRSTVERMIAGFRAVLEQGLAAPDQSISRITAMGEASRQRVVRDWNRTATSWEGEGLTVERFEDQTRRTPNACAVVVDGRRRTYRELNEMADRLAARLSRSGAGRGDVVGILGERSDCFLAGVLAIFKLRAVYLPLDPRHPVKRIAGVLDQARCRLALADVGGRETLSEAYSHSKQPGTILDLEIGETDEAPKAAAWKAADKDDLAYVIFTSGSTGEPKGAMVTHGGMLNHLMLKIRDLGIQPDDLVAQNASQCFDISVWQFLAPLLAGAATRIVSDDTALDPQALWTSCAADGVSILEVVPSVLNAYLRHCRESSDAIRVERLRWLVPTGEALSPELCRDWFREYPDIPLLNAYGPTECSDDVTHHRVEVPPAPNVVRMPIGRAVANTEIYILDKQGNPVPEGVFGEIHVGGDGVGRGYLNRPDLTAGVFAPDPFSGRAGSRLYRTGDSGRFLDGGVVEFAGRLDYQVKIRGFRIELGEIEAAILQHPGVDACVVADREGAGEARMLAAYVVFEAEKDAGGLRTFLLERLPDYMVPAAIMAMNELPLTRNGKIDRKALPAPEYSAGKSRVAPRSPVEELLAEIWRELLKADAFGVDDSFFDLGGHSLLATQAAARIRSSLGKDVTVRDLFEHPTIRRLAGALAERESGGIKLGRIPRVDDGTSAPLSFAQERLWFLDQFEESSATYNMSRGLRLRGPLDEEALKLAFLEVAARHEPLRTVFPSEEGRPRALVLDEAESIFESIDLEGLPQTEQEREARRLAREQAGAPFDLSSEPLIRVRLFRFADDDHLLVTTLHHIISDGWSLVVFVNELSEFYRAKVEGRAPMVEEVPVRYSDYARWQRDVLRGGALEELRSFWRDYLKGAPPLLELPCDRPRPARQRFRGGVIHFEIEKSLKDRLAGMARCRNATLFMAVHAVFSALLSRLSGQDDVVVGIPVANRGSEELESLIGFFVNTVAVRTRMDDDRPFAEALQTLKNDLLQVYERQSLPFEHLVEDMQPDRALSHSPIFQVMLVFQNAQEARLQLGEVEASPFEIPGNNTSKFDLLLTVEEQADGLKCHLEYCTDLFEEATVRRWMEQFKILLEGAASAPETPIGRMPLLSDEERGKILGDWNQTARTNPEGTVVDLIEAWAAKIPEETAAADERVSWTYRELNGKANRVARLLIERGAEPERTVCVLADRSADYLAAMLGVLKSGAAFLGLDPSYPPERLRQILEVCDPVAGLCQPDRRELLEASAESAADWIDLSEALSGEPVAKNPVRRAGPKNAAYLMHTSGTTGKPKGAVIEHAGMLNHILAKNGDTGLTRGDVIAQTASQRFDIFVYQFLAGLIVGGKVRIYPDDIANDPGLLFARAAKDRVTVLEVVPSLMGMFLSEAESEGAYPDLSALRWLIPTGEALPVKTCRQWFERYPAIPLLNAYGHTETSDDVTHEKIEGGGDIEAGAVSISIGRPVRNTTIYILNESFEPAPVGVAGRLYVGGVQAGRGYLGRPDLTARSWVPDPFSNVPGARMYDSGDQARWLPDGRIDYAGRKDHMVKIRGNRIELGEIEAALLKQPGVRACVVTATGERPESRELAAYVTIDPASALAKEERPAAGRIADGLRESLPGFMIPSYFLILDALPLTPNGKIDRKALPAPDAASVEDRAFEAPATETEETLAAIWRGALGLERVGATDQFFNIGGHSLIATRVVSRIRKAFGIEFNLRTLFEKPVLRELAEEVEIAMIDAASDEELESALASLEGAKDE